MRMQLNKENKRDLERTKKRILDAAAREFADHGFSGARVDRIARHARVNKAMLYYIFGNKQDLHLSVLEALFEEKTRNIDDRLSVERMTLPGLLTMLSEYFDALQDRKEYARIMLNDLATGAKTLRRLKRKRPDLFAIFGKIVELLNRMMDQGAIKEIEPEKGVMMVIILLVSLACIGPHIGLVAAKGTAQYQALADAPEWKIFLGRVLQDAAGPKQDNVWKSQPLLQKKTRQAISK